MVSSCCVVGFTFPQLHFDSNATSVISVWEKRQRFDRKCFSSFLNLVVDSYFEYYKQVPYSGCSLLKEFPKPFYFIPGLHVLWVYLFPTRMFPRPLRLFEVAVRVTTLAIILLLRLQTPPLKRFSFTLIHTLPPTPPPTGLVYDVVQRS